MIPSSFIEFNKLLASIIRKREEIINDDSD